MTLACSDWIALGLLVVGNCRGAACRAPPPRGTMGTVVRNTTVGVRPRAQQAAPLRHRGRPAQAGRLPSSRLARRREAPIPERAG
jgi:hypothetical protein